MSGLRMMLATGRDVADEIETELVVKRRVIACTEATRKERVAVAEPAHRLGADVGAGAGRFRDEWLAEPLR